MSNLDLEIKGYMIRQSDGCLVVCELHRGDDKLGIERMQKQTTFWEKKFNKLALHGICDKCSKKYFNN